MLNTLITSQSIVASVSIDGKEVTEGVSVKLLGVEGRQLSLLGRKGK